MFEQQLVNLCRDRTFIRRIFSICWICSDCLEIINSEIHLWFSLNNLPSLLLGQVRVRIHNFWISDPDFCFVTQNSYVLPNYTRIRAAGPTKVIDRKLFPRWLWEPFLPIGTSPLHIVTHVSLVDITMSNYLLLFTSVSLSVLERSSGNFQFLHS